MIASRNRLIVALSIRDRDILRRSLHEVSLKLGEVLNEPGEVVDRIYFPTSGMVSMLAVMRNGKAVETATIGREGGVGTMAGLGIHTTLTRSVIQVPMIAMQISASTFRQAVQTSEQLRYLIVRYNDIILGQVQITAACNALHSIQSRLARWILQTQERVESTSVPLTHELLSEMLGVRRVSVSEIARKLQNTGTIRYARGVIEILDRPALLSLACECYSTLAQHSNLLLDDSI